MGLFQKVKRVLTHEQPLHDIVRVLNKSPLRHLVKGVAAALHPAQKLSRIAAVRRLAMTPALTDRAAGLRQLGYARLDGEIDRALLTELNAYSWSKMARLDHIEANAGGRAKDFWVYLSDEDKGAALTTDHVYVRFALQESILKIVSSYFGEAPYLTYTLLTHSRHTDGPLKVSQLWHCDRDDTKIVKLFTYLSDVSDEQAGPFTFFDRRVSAAIRGPFFMQHLEDERVFGDVDPGARVQMTAPALTSFLVDTGACYHMGSRVAPNHTRLMFTALYTSCPPMYLGDTGNGIAVTRDLTPLQRLALQR